MALVQPKVSPQEEKGIEGVMAEVEKTAEEVETLSVEVMVIELASQRPEEGTEIPSEETEVMVREKVNPLEEVRRRRTISTPSLHSIDGHAAV